MTSAKHLLPMLLTCIFCLTVRADAGTPNPSMPATEIVNKNIAARGGLEAWRSVNTLSLSGKMEAGGNHRTVITSPGGKRGAQIPHLETVDQVQLPFTMELKRGRKQRLELQFHGTTAVQVYDGVNGWKQRPFLNRDDVESYSPDEAQSASSQPDLDGPLVDFAAKGTKVELVGMEKVEERDTYKLKLTMKDGHQTHVWIDASTFLEAKIEGVPRRLDGSYHPVEIYYRDYRRIDGLLFPFLLETRVLADSKGKGQSHTQSTSEKIFVEKLIVNPKLEDALFSKPQGNSKVVKPVTTAGVHAPSR